MEEKISKVAQEKMEKALSDEISQQISNIQGIVKAIEKELKTIEKINIISLVENTNQEKSQRLLKSLDKIYTSNYDKKIVKNLKNKTEIINSITKLYFLTEEYFVKRKVIKNPNFIMTATTPSGLYIRKEFTEELLKNDASNFLDFQENRDGGVGLRFKSSSVLEKMKESIQNDNKELEFSKKLYEHYQNFIEPYQKYEEKGGNINEGVCREAFELHLEQLHKSQLEKKEFKNCRMESVAKRWIKYRVSSGSDPYFTGPDTALSQVKSENAALVGDIKTILNTARFIVMEGNTIGKKKLQGKLKTKSVNEIKTFSKSLWSFLDEDVKEDILKELGGKSVVEKQKYIYIK